ncbi:MAG: hypothetical protein RL011_63 [Pseudomonadota bacterium]|jgi:23S rRNA (cytidine2498-2'-O)-methyltransferase
MTAGRFQVVLVRPGFAELAVEEFLDRWQLQGRVVGPAAVAFDENAQLPKLSSSVFARQLLPRATQFEISEQQPIEAIVKATLKRLEVLSKRANRHTSPWTLHAFAQDDDPATAIANQIEKSLLQAVKQRLPRLYERYIPAAQAQAPGFTDSEKDNLLLVQIYVSTVTDIWFSTASLGEGPSRFVAGNQRMRHFPGAPSRSSSKLEEALVLLGRAPKSGETAIDLGAAPGGWTFTMVRHGASVTAIDHGALKLPADKKFSERVTHLKENGLTYRPISPVDWVVCDMLVGSRETLAVLDRWLSQGLAKNFVFNVKLPQAKPWPVIRDALDLLARYPWAVMRAKHLFHDRQEITLMGSEHLKD